MTLFGIRCTEFIGSDTEYYIGEDATLWDWIQDNNYELTPDGSFYRVEAPEGYVFHQGNLFPAEGYGGSKKSELISLDTPKFDKALMLLVSLRAASSEEFYKQGIQADRIMDIVIQISF